MKVRELKKAPTLGGNASKDNGQNTYPNIVNPPEDHSNGLTDAINNWKDNHPNGGGNCEKH